LQKVIFIFTHVTESSISDSVHFDGHDAVLVQAILAIRAIVKMDPVSHEKVLYSSFICLSLDNPD
jgi:AP-3 complex subunit beta